MVDGLQIPSVNPTPLGTSVGGGLKETPFLDSVFEVIQSGQPLRAPELPQEQAMVIEPEVQPDINQTISESDAISARMAALSEKREQLEVASIAGSITAEEMERRTDEIITKG
jgi:hypothetical protein